MKYAFSAKIWFMKTSTKIMKYESRIIKLNPECCPSMVDTTLHIYIYR